MAEPKKEKKTKKPVRTPALEELPPRAPGALAGSAAGAVAAEATDPFLSRNEFKPGFYNQPDKRPVTAETMYGTGTTRQLDESIMSPDDSMLVQYQQDGGLMDQPHLNYMGAAKGKFIAKGCGKVMSDRRKKTKMY
jgi:hypothetical protein